MVQTSPEKKAGGPPTGGGIVKQAPALAKDPSAAKQTPALLLLSHLFPTSTQQKLGCFVKEEAQALAEAGTRVFVVQGTPFSLPLHRPDAFLRALGGYVRAWFRAGWQEEQGVAVLRVPFLVNRQWLPYDWRWLWYALAVATAWWRCRPRTRISCILAHTAYLDGFTAWLLSAGGRRPYTITEHNWDAPGPYATHRGRGLPKHVTRWALRHAQRVRAVSPWLAGQLAAHYQQAAWLQDKLYIEPLAVNTRLFYPSASPIPSGPPWQLLGVMSLDDNKRPLLLLATVAQLCAQGLPVRLTLVGDGPLRDVVAATVSHNPALANIVTWHPFLSRVDVAQHMRLHCHVLIHTSLQETLGMVVLEALACQKPVVATPCGGPEPFILASGRGTITQDDRPETLAAAVRAWLPLAGLAETEPLTAGWAG